MTAPELAPVFGVSLTVDMSGVRPVGSIEEGSSSTRNTASGIASVGGDFVHLGTPQAHW